MNKKLVSLCLALLLVLTFIPSVASAARTYTISFSAYENYRNTGRLNDVNYEVYDSNGRYIGSTYDYMRLERGTYTVIANKRGYDSIRQKFEVYNDNSVTIDMANYYYGSNKIISANTYLNKVEGEATPYSTVTLYKNGKYVKSTSADSTGRFSITHNFGQNADRSDFYGGYRVYPTNVTSTSVEGFTTAITPVAVYDEYGNFLGATVSSTNGYYLISHESVSRPERKVTIRDYKDDYYKDFDLGNYYLVSESKNYTSERYYLKDSFRKGDNAYYLAEDYATPPTITEALGGEVYIRGEGSTPFATITIRDSNGNILGTKDVTMDTAFAIKTNRTLISGEILRITTSHERFNERTISVVVGGDKTAKGYNYINRFIIGSKEYLQTVNGNNVTKMMDTVPYIVNGRTMLPVRFVAESLGYDVSFDDNTRNAVFINGTNTLIINLDSPKIFVNGYEKTLSVQPETVDGRIMLPVSELGMALGLTHGNIGEGKNIEWDGANRVVIIQMVK